MGAQEVIAAPSKSYVAINSYKSDRSLPSTLCDLGRVSNIAAVVTLPRTSNFITRHNATQNIRSLPNKKIPISEVMNCSSLNSCRENVSTATSATDVIDSNKKRKYTLASQSSTPDLVIPSTVKTILEKNCDSSQQAKRMKLDSRETPNIVSSPDVSATNNYKNNQVSYLEKTQRNLITHLPSSQSTNSPPQRLSLQPVQIRSQETAANSHLQRNQHNRLHGSNTTQLPNQHNVQLPTPVVGQLPTHNSLPMQLQQQNQQLRNENMQLQQQNQQLCNENMQLQKQLSLFRQLIKNPQRLNHCKAGATGSIV